MNKYFGSCWLHNGIVANAFCSLVKCIKRNVIIGFFIYNILVQIFEKFVFRIIGIIIYVYEKYTFTKYCNEFNSQDISNIEIISIGYNDA